MSKAKVKNFKVKKKRINKKKLAFVIVVFFLFFSILIFGAFKLTQTIFSRLDINFNTKNKQVEMNTDVKSNNVEKIIVNSNFIELENGEAEILIRQHDKKEVC